MKVCSCALEEELVMLNSSLENRDTLIVDTSQFTSKTINFDFPMLGVNEDKSCLSMNQTLHYGLH